MFIKLAVLGVALGVIWLVLFRTVRGSGRGPGRGQINPRDKPPELKAQKLEPCPNCGVYRPPGGVCDCDQ